MKVNVLWSNIAIKFSKDLVKELSEIKSFLQKIYSIQTNFTNCI